jgi:pimeloyl-ACP methyl ester carboxylesterase
VVFSGNASVALDWLDFVEAAKDRATAFLLVDYPGYGLCEGKPSRQSIAEASESALTALAAGLKCAVPDLEKNLRVLGFSIGAAAGMEFAVRHPPRRVLLVSPFTSLKDMARIAVGRVLSNVAVDRFDNRARLDELAALPQPPKVVILHGTADDIVPFSMGRELAERQPKIAEFRPVQCADHNSMMLVAHDRIMAEVDGK